jgi:hypothetical protein
MGKRRPTLGGAGSLAGLGGGSPFLARQAKWAAKNAPGGPSNMTGQSGMVTVRAHIRKGRPVRQSTRHLSPGAKKLLGMYRSKKAWHVWYWGNREAATRIARLAVSPHIVEEGRQWFSGQTRTTKFNWDAAALRTPFYTARRKKFLGSSSDRATAKLWAHGVIPWGRVK